MNPSKNRGLQKINMLKILCKTIVVWSVVSNIKKIGVRLDVGEIWGILFMFSASCHQSTFLTFLKYFCFVFFFVNFFRLDLITTNFWVHLKYLEWYYYPFYFPYIFLDPDRSVLILNYLVLVKGFENLG